MTDDSRPNRMLRPLGDFCEEMMGTNPTKTGEVVGDRTMSGPNRAIHEIQSEVQRLATVRITSASEFREWASVSRLADELKDLAQRGLYHESRLKANSITEFAMRGYEGEAESR